jgi:Domain of unknown function (DUF4340)
MRWTRALAYVLVAAVLATVYVVTAPPPPPSPASLPPPPEAPPPAIDSFRLETGGRTVRATRTGGRWEVVEPAGADVPADLIAALVSAVLETDADPVTTDTSQLADFGLVRPWARLSFGRPNGAPVTLALGSANPAETGVYGRLEGKPQVILLGLNVRYYIDLVLKQSRT